MMESNGAIQMMLQGVIALGYVGTSSGMAFVLKTRA
jgi:hypothetical protein